MNAFLRSLALSTGLLAALGLAGCGDDKKKETADADAGAQGPQKPVLDRKLAAAVKAAESAQAASPSKAGSDGPPENGFFGPGLADKAFPPGAPPKIEVIAEGSEPRLRLVPAPADEQKEKANVIVRLQGGAIPCEYSLALKIDKPKDEKKDDKDKKADAPKVWRVVGKVTAVDLPSQISRDAADKLGKLKGSEIRYTIGSGGGVSDLGYTLAKEADPGLGEAVVKGLMDTISLSMPPLPPKPIGAGGYWMVTDRASAFGVEVVRYRVYKVEKIAGDLASLSVDVRQYATKEEAELGGQKMNLLRFESQGKGKTDWTPAALLPARGEVAQKTGIQGTVGAGQQGMFQAEVSGRFTAEEKKK